MHFFKRSVICVEVQFFFFFFNKDIFVYFLKWLNNLC